MKAYYTDHFVLPLPLGHRFPMSKYALLRQRILETQAVPSDALNIPTAASDTQILRCHEDQYLEKVKSGSLSDREMRRIGFPWSPGMVERSRRSVGATICAAQAAIMDGTAVNLAGGTHHAAADHGEGYCVFNDVVIAAREIQVTHQVERVVIIDCDVHQGNGTAALTRDDDSIFTLSIHGEKNFPFRKVPSTIDIGLPDDTGDAEYLEVLEIALERILYMARADVAFYVSGADPFVGDTLGKLALSKEGLALRDAMVLSMCRDSGLPVVVTMGGGYARNVHDIVDIHLETVRTAAYYQNGS